MSWGVLNGTSRVHSGSIFIRCTEIYLITNVRQEHGGGERRRAGSIESIVFMDVNHDAVMSSTLKGMRQPSWDMTLPGQWCYTPTSTDNAMLSAVRKESLGDSDNTWEATQSNMKYVHFSTQVTSEYRRSCWKGYHGKDINDMILLLLIYFGWFVSHMVLREVKYRNYYNTI